MRELAPCENHRKFAAIPAEAPCDRDASRRPINQPLETLGDRRSLIILRDTMFGGRRRYHRAGQRRSADRRRNGDNLQGDALRPSSSPTRRHLPCSKFRPPSHA